MNVAQEIINLEVNLAYFNFQNLPASEAVPKDILPNLETIL